MSASIAAEKSTAPKGKDDIRASEIEMSMFSLRDTLNGIVVRDANFGEFLAALRACNTKMVKPS